MQLGLPCIHMTTGIAKVRDSGKEKDFGDLGNRVSRQVLARDS